VILVRTVVQFLASKAHIKLNPKKVYQSDGYAVKELIKVCRELLNLVYKTYSRNKIQVVP
jgi:clusterin-associated protein 1